MSEQTQEETKISPTVKHIKNAYHYGESKGFIAYAPRGFGKTAWQVHVAARCLGTTENPDYEAVKAWLIFTPKQFCQYVLKTYTMKITLVWDDAGYWLNRLFWYDEFVREALRYMTLQRTQFASILFSTPSLTLLPNKILELEDVYRVKIYKMQTNYNAPKTRPRLAWVKIPWYSDDLKKHGCSTVWKEKFSAMMPDDFYGWYEPLRKQYALLAAERIKRAIERTERENIKVLLKQEEESLRTALPSHEEVAEFKEVIAQCQN